MIKSHIWMFIAAALVLIIGCGAPPQVIQGTVTSYDAASKTLVLADEREPRRELTFSLEGAEVGAQPVAGDVVRLSYRVEGGQQKVIRVMDLSRQEELQKKAH